jgi:hypothetical protein
MKDKTLELIKFPSSLSNDIQIFEHILYNHYTPPKGFSLDFNGDWDI